jgi:hypothetical protein
MTKTAMTYTVFGVSFYRGAHRLRFSNDLASRMKTLIQCGDEEINLVELPTAMSKMQAVQWAQASGQFETDAEKAVIAAFIEKNSKIESAEPKKRGRPRKADVAEVPTLSDAIDADEALVDSVEGSDELSDEELLAQLAAEEQPEEDLEADVA